MTREFWLIWDDAAATFNNKGFGAPGDGELQILGDGQRLLKVPMATYQKNGNWTADDVRGLLLEQLSAVFAREVARGCVSPKGRVECDDQALLRYTASLRFVEEVTKRGLPVEPIIWTMWDRSQVEHTLEELEDMGLAMGVGFQAKMRVRQAKEAQLRDPEATVQDVMAVDLDHGWP